MGISFKTNMFTILIICVYLPYDSSDNYDEYKHYLAKLNHIINEHDSPYVYVVGDFNAYTTNGSRFGRELQEMCDKTSLVVSDLNMLSLDTFTFISKAHGSTSWLDHCVTTGTGHNIISDFEVLTNYVSSDHIPLQFIIKCDVSDIVVSNYN